MQSIIKLTTPILICYTCPCSYLQQLRRKKAVVSDYRLTYKQLVANVSFLSYGP